MFKQFKNSCNSVDYSNLQTAIYDVSFHEKVISIASNTSEFAWNQREELKPLNNYEENLEFTIIFLEEFRKEKYSFSAGFREITWCSIERKSNLLTQNVLTKNQFKLSKQGKYVICNICSFVLKCYVDSWIQAVSAYFAPRNDVQLLKNIKEYKDISSEIWK